MQPTSLHREKEKKYSTLCNRVHRIQTYEHELPMSHGGLHTKRAVSAKKLFSIRLDATTGPNQLRNKIVQKETKVQAPAGAALTKLTRALPCTCITK